eukprot:scaffold1486_cov332-Pinguiococcus_pyrenoidosus.AAC.2
MRLISVTLLVSQALIDRVKEHEIHVGDTAGVPGPDVVVEGPPVSEEASHVRNTTRVPRRDVAVACLGRSPIADPAAHSGVDVIHGGIKDTSRLQAPRSLRLLDS